MKSWCAPSCPPRRSFVASDARRRGQLCIAPTRPESTYKSGKAVQTTAATSHLVGSPAARDENIGQNTVYRGASAPRMAPDTTGDQQENVG